MGTAGVFVKTVQISKIDTDFGRAKLAETFNGRGQIGRDRVVKVGRGDNRAVTELGFAHVTTKTWAYFGVFSFFRKNFGEKTVPPPPKSLFENTMGNSFFGTPFFGTKRSTKKI